MSLLLRFLKDPLFHFLAAGGVLFAAGAALEPAEAPEPPIIIDRAKLLEFIQYRSRAFDPAAAEALLESLTPERREALIRDLAEEEALYREAEALSLTSEDYVIKQRMIEKVRFIAESGVGEPEVTDSEAREWYEAHAEDYAIPPNATLAHIFFNKNETGLDAALIRAREILPRLKAANAGFEDALRYGDRFLFHTNYVERTHDYILSQLGADTAAAVFDENAALNEWRGPYVSPYGAHLIFVRSADPGRMPPLEEVRDRVFADAARDKKRRLVEDVLAGVVADYDIRIDIGVGEGGAGAAP